MFTKTERRVLYYISQGKSNKFIADKLDISVRTAECHRAKIIKKTGKNGGELIVWASKGYWRNL